MIHMYMNLFVEYNLSKYIKYVHFQMLVQNLYYYKYLVYDKNQCLNNGCPIDYYQFNFECYKNKCPDDTIQNLVEINKCESNLNYCYIDENYKTHCNKTFYDEYNLRYKDTKIYFKSCDESLIFLE